MQWCLNLFWLFTSGDEAVQPPCSITEARLTRLTYIIVAALFIVFFVTDELVNRYRENRREKCCARKNTASALEDGNET